MADFHESYASGKPPWDIDGPQPAFVELQKRGAIQGSVLDVGCGTGENALFLASQGLSVTGIDMVPLAIDQAKQKSLTRGVCCEFAVGDALALKKLGKRFDSVIDSGVFHVFSDDDRRKYVESLASVIKPNGKYFMLVFSDSEMREGGPRRISRREVGQAFSLGWQVESLSPTLFSNTLHEGGSRAWIAVIQRNA